MPDNQKRGVGYRQMDIVFPLAQKTQQPLRINCSACARDANDNAFHTTPIHEKTLRILITNIEQGMKNEEILKRKNPVTANERQ